MSTAIRVESLSKQYRLGAVGTGTLSHDLNRWWHRARGKEDPYLKIGEANDRTKKAGSDYAWALKDISFEVIQGEVLGVIGRNGAGKSTLLKILSRVTKPTSGSVKVRGRIASLLEVGTGFHPELTGRENIFLNGAILGMRKSEIRSKLDGIIDFSGVERYIDTPVKRYSSGMSVRLAFAVAAHLDPEILIIDEVLAVGDHEFQQKCLGKMGDVARSGRTILFVSHNLAAVGSLCSRSIVMESGQLVFQGSQHAGIQFYHDSVLHAETTSRITICPQKKPLPIELRELRVLNATRGKDPDAALETGDAVDFEVDCTVHETGKHFAIGIGLQGRYNERLLTLHSRCDPSMQWHARGGMVTIRCHVASLPLRSGTVSLVLAASSGKEVIQTVHDAMTLRIHSSDYFENGGQNVGGLFYLKQSWTMQPKRHEAHLAELS